MLQDALGYFELGYLSFIESFHHETHVPGTHRKINA